MNDKKRSARRVLSLSLAKKRRILLGLTDLQARELLSAGNQADLEAVGDRIGLNADRVQLVLTDPEALKGLRMDPNQLSRWQLEQIPDLMPEEIDRILQGKPYYSLEELEAITLFSKSTLQEIFEIKPYQFLDPITMQEVILEPVIGRYILPPSDFEEDPALAEGYVNVYVASPRTPWRLVEAADFEAEQHTDILKRKFKGQVYPVLRDREGFERYLVPGVVDVWFHRGTPIETRSSLLKKLHLVVTESVPEVGYYRTRLVLVPETGDMVHAVLDAISAAIQLPEVKFAEPDQLGFEDFDHGPEDRHSEEDFEAAANNWNELSIKLAGAHAIHRGSDDVTILIIDSGCHMDHEALNPVFRHDWQTLDLSFDLYEAAEDMSPDEITISHGTQVAGVVARVAPGCRILPIKIPGNSGGPAAPGYGLRAAAILKALDYISAGKHAVMNMSWKTNGEHIGIREALREAETRGLVLVASAGNYDPGFPQRPNDLHYPSAHSYRAPANRSLLSVAALGPGDIRASYSYYGSESITVSAPGGEAGGIGGGIQTTSTPNSYACVAGTSFATPHVAGLAALLFSAKPELSAGEVVLHILNTADCIDDPNPGFRSQLGVGRINAQAALEAAVGVAAPSHTITAMAGPHGAVVPTGAITVPVGGSFRFEFIPDPGYRIVDVLFDGASIGTPTSHSLTGVSADHTVEVTFVEQAGVLTNINTASAEALEALPYIGPWLAGQIVSYRQVHGPYSSIWDLKDIGMSSWAIGQIAAMITV